MEGRGLPFGQREAAERREGGSCPLAARSNSTGKQKEGGQLADVERTGGQHENAVQSPSSRSFLSV